VRCPAIDARFPRYLYSSLLHLSILLYLSFPFFIHHVRPLTTTNGTSNATRHPAPAHVLRAGDTHDPHTPRPPLVCARAPVPAWRRWVRHPAARERDVERERVGAGGAQGPHTGAGRPAARQCRCGRQAPERRRACSRVSVQSRLVLTSPQIHSQNRYEHAYKDTVRTRFTDTQITTLPAVRSTSTSTCRVRPTSARRTRRA